MTNTTQHTLFPQDCEILRDVNGTIVVAPKKELERVLKTYRGLSVDAAPELLEALERVQDFVHELIEEQKRLENKPITYGQATLLDICQEAIAKAKGQA